jgi:nucleoside-diphosphate-sugar epimerase
MRSLQLSEPLDFRSRRLFVTGATGFVGRTLLDYLAESAQRHGADFEVTALSRDPSAFLGRFPRYAELRWLRFQAGDLADLGPSSQRFTDVLHAAADTHSAADGAAWIEQIVGGTRKALAFAQSTGARRFLLTSSGAVYGPQPATLSHLPEDHGGAPSTDTLAGVYGQAKRVAEQLCTVYQQQGLQTVRARCFAFVGEHVPLDGPYAIGNFIRDALFNAQIAVKGDGTAVRSYLDGRDMAHWLLTMLLHGEAGAAYNVGSDQAITMAELAHTVAGCLAPGKPVVIEHGADAAAGRSVYVPGIAKAARLGLQVETPLDVAIRTAAERLLR